MQFMDVVLMALGAALLVAGYIAYTALKKGVPAAKNMVVAWWKKGKAEAAALKGDVAKANAELADMKAKVEQHAADITALKAKVGL